MLLVEDLGSDGFSRRMKMPLVRALEIKKSLEDMGAEIRENKIYTSGPRTMFKFSLELKRELNEFSELLIRTEIKGEFETASLFGVMDISTDGKVVTKYPSGGFMTSSLVDYYNKHLYFDFLKFARDEFLNVKKVIE